MYVVNKPKCPTSGIRNTFATKCGQQISDNIVKFYWSSSQVSHFGCYFCINQTKILYLGSVLRDVKLTPLCDTHSSVSSMSPFGSSCHGPDHHLCSLWSGKNPELNNFWSGRAERGNWWGLGGLVYKQGRKINKGNDLRKQFNPLNIL